MRGILGGSPVASSQGSRAGLVLGFRRVLGIDLVCALLRALDPMRGPGP